MTDDAPVTAKLHQIVDAAIAEEGRFDPRSCRQVCDIRLVCCRNGHRFYAIEGKTFRSVTAFAWYLTAIVTPEGKIRCISENSARNAEAMAFLWSDRVRDGEVV